MAEDQRNQAIGQLIQQDCRFLWLLVNKSAQGNTEIFHETVVSYGEHKGCIFVVLAESQDSCWSDTTAEYPCCIEEYYSMGCDISRPSAITRPGSRNLTSILYVEEILQPIMVPFMHDNATPHSTQSFLSEADIDRLSSWPSN